MKLQINVELLHPLNENLQKYQNIHSFQKKKKKKKKTKKIPKKKISIEIPKEKFLSSEK